MRYLVVTHIPFARTEGCRVVVDALWARDLEGLAASVGDIRVVGPEISSVDALETWGPSTATMEPGCGIEFIGFPPLLSRKDLWKLVRIRSVLRREVKRADLVHTSNLFGHYVALSYAHDLAARIGKKTVFVVAEDFYDMLEWEWVRLGPTSWDRRKRRNKLNALDRRVRKTAASADLTFLHTPAAVSRYRLNAKSGFAIRQPGHELEDVVSEPHLTARCEALERGIPLQIAAACRHRPLKGLDLLIAAVARLAETGIRVEAHLYGSGESTPTLRALASSLGVTDVVHFRGALTPGPAIYRAIAGCHLFAMPHRTTDFGRSFFDAMAGALPVLAFHSPASDGTVRHEVDGLLAPADDVEGLAAAIARFHHDRQFLVRASWAARSRALHNTRSAWHRWRSEWIGALFNCDRPSQK